MDGSGRARQTLDAVPLHQSSGLHAHDRASGGEGPLPLLRQPRERDRRPLPDVRGGALSGARTQNGSSRNSASNPERASTYAAAPTARAIPAEAAANPTVATEGSATANAPGTTMAESSAIPETVAPIIAPGRRNWGRGRS